MKYKAIEGITTADMAYEVYGETIKDLFINAAEVLTKTVIDIDLLESKKRAKFHISSPKLSDLLYDFLNELIFLKDSKNLVFSKYNIKIHNLSPNTFDLQANLYGEKINPAKHKLFCDVKAVTKHKFFVKQENNRFIARFVLDV